MKLNKKPTEKINLKSKKKETSSKNKNFNGKPDNKYSYYIDKSLKEKYTIVFLKFHLR